jgi:hypothetical protein
MDGSHNDFGGLCGTRCGFLLQQLERSRFRMACGAPALNSHEHCIISCKNFAEHLGDGRQVISQSVFRIGPSS